MPGKMIVGDFVVGVDFIEAIWDLGVPQVSTTWRPDGKVGLFQGAVREFSHRGARFQLDGGVRGQEW